MKSIPRISSVIVSVIALVASGLVGATAANAATGSVTEFPLPAGSTPRDVAPGPDGNMWVTGGASNTITRVAPDGTEIAYALPLPANVGNPWGIAAGPDGNMWFTLRDGGRLGRITMQGGVSVIDLPDASMRPQDIAQGPDGNMWFTELGGRIGRVTMAGAVTMFPVPWANSRPVSLVQGPTGSSRMYFTDAGADRIAFVLMDGTTFGSVSLTAGADPTGIANVNGNIWFSMPARNQMARLVADTSVLELAVPGAPSNMTSAADNTMWVSLPGRNAVAKYSVEGAPLGEFGLPSPNSLPAGLAEGPGANIWVAQTNAGRLGRVVSGQVPVATAPPTISPATGVQAGTTLTAAEGAWNFSPTSYQYQWQACTSGTDANTCSNIQGANAKTFVPTAANNNQFIRVLVQGVNASGSGAPTPSAFVAVATTPPAPPSPVSGGQTVTVAQGVTLTLRATNRTRAGVRRPFAVIANTANIRGKVRITIVDSAGRERQVIAKGRVMRPFGNDGRRALRRNVVSRNLSPGTYQVKAVFTPAPAFRNRYPVATMTKPITIRR